MLMMMLRMKVDVLLRGTVSQGTSVQEASVLVLVLVSTCSEKIASKRRVLFQQASAL